MSKPAVYLVQKMSENVHHIDLSLKNITHLCLHSFFNQSSDGVDLKNIAWVMTFHLICLLELIGELTGLDIVIHVTKPLIIPSLCLLVSHNQSVHWLITSALLFSWFGDVLLMFKDRVSPFIIGISCFGVTHICHIVYLIHGHFQLRLHFSNLAHLAIIPITALLLPIFTGPIKVPGLKLAIRCYIIVLAMLLYTTLTYGTHAQLLACLLFIISDSLIAVGLPKAPTVITKPTKWMSRLNNTLIMMLYMTANKLQYDNVQPTGCQ